MTISEEQIVELAQQYLSKLQKANEIEFATFKPGVGEDYYVFLDVLEEECSHFSDCLTIGYQNKEVEGMFLAQIAISMPLYLALPIFLLIFLNRKQTRNEVASWR